MTPSAQQLLERGVAAAYQRLPASDGARRTAAIFLGYVYRKEGRYEDAIAALERGLPYPAAFKELVSIYRFLGKAARKESDRPAEAEAFRKMYSLARINRETLRVRVPGNPVSVDWDRVSQWLDDVRAKCGSIYAYAFDGQRIEDDELLSNADYKVLASLQGGS